MRVRASAGFWVDLRERRDDFLGPSTSFGLSWLDLLAGVWSGLSCTGEEEKEREMSEVAREEERELSEVAEEGFEFEGERRGGDGVVGSWAIVGRVSILMGSRGGSIVPSGADGSVAGLWVWDGDAISWARVRCVPSSARSWAGGDFPSNGLFLVHILISASSERYRFFRARAMSFGDQPVWE